MNKMITYLDTSNETQLTISSDEDGFDLVMEPSDPENTYFLEMHFCTRDILQMLEELKTYINENCLKVEP
jgi:hypothetical protein